MNAFNSYLRTNLRKHSKQHLALFAGLICERMYPNYIFFSEREQWGDNTLLEEALVINYSCIKNNEIDKKEIKRLIKNLEKISPDLDEFTDSASYALDACSAFDELLNYLLDNDIEHIYNVSEASTNTVDMFIQELEKYESDSDLEHKIATNKYMLAEVNFQKMIISKLKEIPIINNKVIEDLRLINKMNLSINLDLIY